MPGEQPTMHVPRGGGHTIADVFVAQRGLEREAFVRCSSCACYREKCSMRSPVTVEYQVLYFIYLGVQPVVRSTLL